MLQYNGHALVCYSTICLYHEKRKQTLSLKENMCLLSFVNQAFLFLNMRTKPALKAMSPANPKLKRFVGVFGSLLPPCRSLDLLALYSVQLLER